MPAIHHRRRRLTQSRLSHINETFSSGLGNAVRSTGDIRNTSRSAPQQLPGCIPRHHTQITRKQCLAARNRLSQVPLQRSLVLNPCKQHCHSSPRTIDQTRLFHRAFLPPPLQPRFMRATSTRQPKMAISIPIQNRPTRRFPRPYRMARLATTSDLPRTLQRMLWAWTPRWRLLTSPCPTCGGGRPAAAMTERKPPSPLLVRA